MRSFHEDDDCPELGDGITVLTMFVVYAAAVAAGLMADDLTVTFVSAIAIGVPVTFVQVMLRHAWNKRRRRRRDTTAARTSAAPGSAYDAPSTRRT